MKTAIIDTMLDKQSKELIDSILIAMNTNMQDILFVQKELSEIEQFHPDTILALGESALLALSNIWEGQNFHELRGQYLPSPWENCVVMPTYHPKYIMQQPMFFIDFVNDIIKAREPRRAPIAPEKVVIQSYEQLKFELEAVKRYWHYCGSNPLIAVDIETTGLDFRHDYIRAFGFSVSRHYARIVPAELVHDERCLKLLQEFFGENIILLITHNGIAFDDPFVNFAWGIKLSTTFDTMLMHYVLDERQGTHGLDELAKTYYGMGNYKKTVRKAGYDTSSEEDLYDMLAIDVCLTYALYNEILKPKIIEEGFEKLLYERVFPSARALSMMEQNGVVIDVDYLLSLGDGWYKEASKMIETLRSKLDDPDFNPRSPQQVAKLIYDDYGWPKVRGFKDRTTDVKALNIMLRQHNPESEEYQIVQTIIDVRQLLHLKSTYVDGIIKRLGDDGRIRTNLKIHGTVTSRLSSSDPNLQNIPQLIGPDVRNAFVSSKGYTLIEGDYSQLELRVGCFYSHDPAYTYAFQNNIDIHASVAAEIYGIPIEEVTHNQRHFAKYFNFGLPYGRGDESMAEQMGKSLEEAKAFHQAWNEKYAVHKKWMDSIKREAIMNGELKSYFGQVRRFPFITEHNKDEIEREALNFPVQSMAAQICLESIVRLYQAIITNTTPCDVRLLLTVHDSILIECPDEYVDIVAPWMKKIMENVSVKAPYPWIADIKVGKRWGSLEKWSKKEVTTDESEIGTRSLCAFTNCSLLCRD